MTAVATAARRPYFRDPEDSFAARVAWDGEHLVWIAANDGRGYGHIRISGRNVKAHRFSYERDRGPIPEGMYVDHICHTPACVLPDHLRLADTFQNAWNINGAASNNRSTGRRNVYRVGDRYVVKIKQHGKSRGFGTYATIEEASAVASVKRAEVFGEFAGRP